MSAIAVDLAPVPVIIPMGARLNRLNEVTAMILIDSARLCTAETGLLIERAAVTLVDGRIIAVLRGEGRGVPTAAA